MLTRTMFSKRAIAFIDDPNGGDGNVTVAVDSNTLNVDGKDTGFTDTITSQGTGGSHVTTAGSTTNATTLAMSSRDLIGNGTPSIAGRHTGADKLQAGSSSAGGTLDVFGTIDSGVVLPVASSFASERKIEDVTTSATAVAVTSADQVLKIGGIDTGSMTTITSGGLTLSISSAIFMDAGSTTTITSGGLTKGNTLALSGTVSNVNSSVRVYDGATLLGTATFSVEDPHSWGFVTAVLPDGSHSFTVTATDNAGNTATMSAVTATIDATPPNVTSVSSRVRGSVKTGEVVQITLNMSEAVTVLGTPGLLLNDGGTATYASGSGTRALTFEYTVPSNQGTSDLRVIGDTLPSSNAIQDLAGNAADLSAAGADLHLKVGSTTTAPTTTTLTGTQQTELFGPSSVNVTFASGATGSLILDASSQFTGTIAGLNSSAPFETIDLADIAFGSNTTVVYLASSADTGTLTVSDGTHTANIALLGQYSPTSFKIASDDHGGTAVVDPLLSTSGSWSSVFSWPLIGLHSLLTPDGKILSYGTDQSGLQGAYKIYDVWDPITNTHNTLPNKTFTDEFCSAAEIIPQTGDVILTGGDARPLGSVNTGVPDTNIFDYRTDSLTPNPSGPMAFARWYPTLITLDTGQLLILGGADLSGTGVGYPEIYTPGDGWRTLTGGNVAEFAQHPYYPRAWQASSGKVITFATDGSGNVYSIDPSGNGQVSVVGHTPETFAFNEPAIMFAQDRCLILGSDGSAWIMDISGSTPVFTATGSLPPDRIWSNLTVLPDGRVMVSGGSAVDSNSNPSLSVTDADNTVAIWDSSTGLWTSTGANAAVPRLYHSTAILLPDATILSLGGGGLDPNEPSMNHLNGEIYSPGYLFDTNGAAAVRPVIQQAPLDLSPGQTFTVRVDNPANIRTLALMPFGSTTHAFNTTARRIELPFSVQADGSLSVTLPVNSDVVPPGDWMLFAIGNNGAPSIASTVQINPYLSLSSTIGTDTGSTATITSTITSSGTTKDNTLALSGTLSVARGFGSVQVYDGATLLGAATIIAGNWSYTTPALLDGSHSFTARAIDNTGKTTTTFAATATVDTTPPTETISTTIITDTGATGTITSGGVTKDNTLGLSGTVSDAGGVSSVQVYDGATLLGAALVSSYAASYPFNESSGTTTADASGHGITGTLVNGATFTTAGKYGNALALDGVNDYVDLGNPGALQLTGSMTVSAWINATAFPGDDAAVVSDRSSGNLGFQLDTTVDTGRRTIGFKLTNSSGVDMIRYGATTLQTNTWYHIAGVYDAAAQTLHVYLNGQLDDGQLLGTVTATQQPSTLDVEIGQRPGNPGVFQFNGRIDDVRIADRAMTQSQVQADMATPAAAAAGGWSYTTPALLDGSHSFTATATDNAGNTTITSAVTATVNTGTVDTTPPTETISTTIITDTGATGTITSGGVTKDNTLGLSGTVSDAGGISSVQVYDGATLLGAATIIAGNWSYTTPALLDGSHSFTAKATDNAGNTTITSAVTATVNTGTVDTTPPTETISTTIITDTGATGTITSGGVTKDNTLGLSGTVSDAGGISSVQVYDGATLLGAATIIAGNWSYTTPALLDGSHSFTAKATDNAGNTTITSAVTATVNTGTVDTTPPTETISTTIITDTGATGTITSGGVTKDNTLGLSGTVSDAGGVSSVQVYDGATLLGAALVSSSDAASYPFNESSGTTTADASGHGITGTLVNGATFTTAGKYGNALALDGVNDYVDLGNPGALQLTGSMTVSAWINATAFPGDDAAVVSDRSSGNLGFQLDTTVDTGRRTIGFKLTNSSGVDMIRYGATTLQTNTWYHIAGVYDAAAQTLHVYLNGQLDDGQLLGTVTATQQPSTLDVEIGQRPGNPGVFQFNGRIDDVRIADRAMTQSQVQADMATPAAAGGWSYTTPALLDGSHSFTATATDNAGNTTITSAVMATVDTTPPTETISTTIITDTGATGTITSGGVTKDNTLGLSGTVSDASEISSVQVYDGATLLGAATIIAGNWSYTTPALLDGSHSFTAKATDNAGSTTITSAVTAMVDTKPPALSGIVASPATANLNAGKTVTLTANFSEAVAVGSGMPTLNLNDGGTATYVSGSSSSALTFTYTIAAGQNTSDLQVNGFNGATIQDGAGNSANLSGITAANPVNPTGTLKIDTTAPTVISVVASPSKGTIATGKTVNIKLNMSENVTVATGAGSPTLLLNDGGTATYTSGSGTNALTFTYTVPANQGTADLQVVGIILPSANSIQDLAGNNANLSGAAADLKLKIDTVTTTASGATISGAQTLELFGASAENITFSAGSTGTLRLDAATSFSGTVSGLALGNALDLANVAYTAGMTVGYQPNTSGPAGGLLTVGLANIALLGSYMASMFVASSDGQGGTLVVDPPPTSTTQSPILTQHVA